MRWPEPVDGPVVGHRAWRVLADRRSPTLMPAIVGASGREWRSAEYVAGCSRRDPIGSGTWRMDWPEDRVLAEVHLTDGVCTCGVHAWRDRARAVASVPAAMYTGQNGYTSDHTSDEWMNVMVIGTVELAGVVAEHELGYRAQRARVTDLTLLEPRGCSRCGRPLVMTPSKHGNDRWFTCAWACPMADIKCAGWLRPMVSAPTVMRFDAVDGSPIVGAAEVVPAAIRYSTLTEHVERAFDVRLAIKDAQTALHHAQRMGVTCR